MDKTDPLFTYNSTPSKEIRPSNGPIVMGPTQTTVEQNSFRLPYRM